MIIAFIAVRKRNSAGVNSLLSVWGVVAQAFESVPERVSVAKVEDLFQESNSETHVVGVEKVGNERQLEIQDLESSENLRVTVECVMEMVAFCASEISITSNALEPGKY